MTKEKIQPQEEEVTKNEEAMVDETAQTEENASGENTQEEAQAELSAE